MSRDYVEPHTGEVDPIDPPKVEYVEPNVESLPVESPVVEPVAPVFIDMDDEQAKPEPQQKQSKGKAKK